MPDTGPYHRLAYRSLAIIAGLIAWAVVAGCATVRDFQAPKERVLERSAYTLQHREMKVSMGLVGVGTQDLGASLGLDYGLGDRYQMGINFAHATLGVLNGSFKVNLVDNPRWALGLKAEVR